VGVEQNESLHHQTHIKVEQTRRVDGQNEETFLSREEVGEIEEEVEVAVEGEEQRLGVEVVPKTETEETAILTTITIM
jgi:hypothetical protein